MYSVTKYFFSNNIKRCFKMTKGVICMVYNNLTFGLFAVIKKTAQ